MWFAIADVALFESLNQGNSNAKYQSVPMRKWSW
jgi:hypothetical protein